MVAVAQARGESEMQAMCIDCGEVFDPVGSNPKCPQCGGTDIDEVRVWRVLPKVQGLAPREVVVARVLEGRKGWSFERACQHVLRTKRYDRMMDRRMKEAQP